MIVFKRIRRVILVAFFAYLFVFINPHVSASEEPQNGNNEILETEYNAFSEEELEDEELMATISEFIYLDAENKVQIDSSYKNVLDSSMCQEIDELELFLEDINGLVDEGTVEINEDGYYRIADLSSDCVIQSAVNDFSVRHKAVQMKIFWKTVTIYLPVGYTIKLNTFNSLILGIASFAFNAATVGAAQKKYLCDGSFFQSLGLSGINFAVKRSLDEFGKLLYAMTYAASVTYISVSAAVAAGSGGTSVVLNAILKLAAAYIWVEIGSHFLALGVKTLLNNVMHANIDFESFISRCEASLGNGIGYAFNTIKNACFNSGVYVNTNLVFYYQSSGEQI